MKSLHGNKKDFRFDKRASSYDKGFEGKLSQKFYNALLQQVELKQGQYVLDVGCGTGFLLSKIADKCEINGFGIDIEENMIAEAKKKCPQMNIQLSRCEATPFDDHTFDVLTACMAYHHFSDKKGFAKEAARILKTGGYLYISDPHFPVIIRKPLNTFLKVFNIAGYFGTPHEIYASFAEYGFEPAGFAVDGYAQVVKLKLTQ